MKKPSKELLEQKKVKSYRIAEDYIRTAIIEMMKSPGNEELIYEVTQRLITCAKDLKDHREKLTEIIKKTEVFTRLNVGAGI